MGTPGSDLYFASFSLRGTEEGWSRSGELGLIGLVRGSDSWQLWGGREGIDEDTFR